MVLEIKNTTMARPILMTKSSQTKKSVSSKFNVESFIASDIDSVSDDLSGTSPIFMESIFLLSSQQLGSDDKKRGLRYGYTMMDALEKLRQDILKGNLSIINLHKLKQVARDIFISSDPKLQEIIDDIRIRVEVELAKLEQQGGV